VSLLGSARVMALGTVASRATGFLRTAVLVAALGVKGPALAFNLANTAPNIVYELLLGGILTSVVVPLLVRAAKTDGDQGEAYAQRLLTLTVLVLGAASVLLVVFAPLVVDLYADADTSPETRDLAVVFARYFLPQVMFYGAGAVMGAYLNTRGRFGPPMWAPVLNNLVVIATGLVFLLVSDPGELTSASITPGQVTVLGVGVTLGIVAQTAALLPALRATGLRLRPRFDFRGTGLGAAARLARWTFVYVVLNQLSYLVVVRLATGAEAQAPGRGYSSYVYGFLLWQLPHAVVAVSLITALLPGMSRSAADGRLIALRQQLDRGLRLTVVVLVPAAVAYVVLGRSIATVLFAHGQTTVAQARFIGVLLGVFAVGLVAFSSYQLQLRAFYALQDTRTPALINLWVNATLVVVDVVLYLLLPEDLRVVGLAAGQAASFVAGLAVCTRVLSRRLGGPGDGRVRRTAVRCLVAAALPAVAAGLVGRGVAEVLGIGPGAALVTVVVAGGALAVGYLVLVRRMRVPEVDEVAGPVLARLGARRAGSSRDEGGPTS
jgi:putative peptidoglycan lipid II flippase